MQGLARQILNIVVVGAVASMGAACAYTSDLASNIGSASLLPKVETFTRPDWLTYSGGKEDFALRPVGPEDLVGAQGECPITPEQTAATQAAPRGPLDGGAGAPRESVPESPQDIPLQGGGIALQMSECEVVRRAGPPERLEFGAGERGQRNVVITYIRGPRPGIYRFSEGRLYSIERAPEPPPTAKQKAKPAKKKSDRG
jgi:hypothetical protein